MRTRFTDRSSRGNKPNKPNKLRNKKNDIYQIIFENSSTAIAVLEADSTVSMVNDAFCQMSGFSKEEILGESWITQMTPEESERLRSYNQGRLKVIKDIPNNYEFIFYTPKGEKRYGLISASLVSADNKTIVAFTDITERKKAEEAQRISEERYRTLVEYANDIVYSITNDGTFNYVSPNWTERLGHELSEVLGHNFVEFVHPNDIQRLMGLIRQNFETAEKLSNVEYQIRHKDGQWRWHSSSSSPIQNEAGQVVSIIGIGHDITERKLAEQAKLESEALLNTLVQTIPDLVWLKNTDGVYLSCNTMFERFFGSPQAEIVGKTDYDFVPRELADFFREKDRIAMEKGGPSRNEEWIAFADD